MKDLYSQYSVIKANSLLVGKYMAKLIFSSSRVRKQTYLSYLIHIVKICMGPYA